MHSHKDKEPEEFKVVDRRLFTSDGELRADLPPDPPESPKPAAAPPPPPAAPPRPKPEEAAPEAKAAPSQRAPAAEPPAKAAGPEPVKMRPDAAPAIRMPDQMVPDQSLDNPEGLLTDQLAGQPTDAAADPTLDQGPVQFEHLIMSLVSTAMYQLGMAARPGEPPPRPDLRAAQETIDLLSLLTEKTKGNLTREEDALLSGSLQELRLAFVELARRAGRIR